MTSTTIWVAGRLERLGFWLDKKANERGERQLNFDIHPGGDRVTVFITDERRVELMCALGDITLEDARRAVLG